MAKSNTRDADELSAPLSSTVLILLGTVADTTARLFIPTIGGTILGIWIDHMFDTRPWATIAGVTIGSIVSAGLIYLQLRKVRS